MGGLYEYIKMAAQNIRANKGRSFLTMLGIIIGIASVIAIVSIGEGTKNQMNSEIDGIGSGLIAIDVSNDAMTEDEWITPDDVQEIRKLDTVGGVSVSNNYDGETVTGKGNFSIMLTGEGPDAKMINNSDMKYGSYFGETEIEEGKNVCVISDTDARQLFGTDDVVGMSLDITCYDSSKSFRIMGVTTQKENGTFVSYTYDGMPVTVNVPYSSMDDLVGGTDEFYSITVVQADKTLDSQIVADQVVHLLEKRHQCAGEDYFHVQSFQDVLQSMNEMLGMVTAFISFVAGISLLVGGIGVMNIMLVSVTERTREIGIVITWRQDLFYYVTVPCGSGNPYSYGRRDWNYSWNSCRLWNLFYHEWKHGNDDHTGNQPDSDSGGNTFLLCGRCIFWNLSGEESCKTQSDRGFETKLS